MLRLSAFDVYSPQTVQEVVVLLARHSKARIIAGGTDILPNLKHRLDDPSALISLAHIPALREISVDPTAKEVRIGAAVTLAQLSDHADVRERFASLATAASMVASPSIRNMATIGGNLNLDTRCRYVNQTAFWRSAIGGCLKSEGNVCHVVPKGRNCVAAMSSDCAPVLVTLDARVALLSQDGEREVRVADYYNTDGVNHLNKQPHELLTEVRVPVLPSSARTTYAKWTVRDSIDFPLVSVALRFDLADDRIDAPIQSVHACVGVLNAKPRVIKRLDAVRGMTLTDDTTRRHIAAIVHAQCKPLENVPYEAPYRRKMIPVYARRAIEQLVATR